MSGHALARAGRRLHRPRHGQEEAMVFKAFARAGFVVALGAFVSVGGCRSSTDRIRVLEAEKADAERRNQLMKQQQAELRTQMVKAEGDADSSKARAEALEARLELLRDRESAGTAGGGEKIDADLLRRSFEGTGVTVNEREDGGATLVLASDITFHPGHADLSTKAQDTLGRVVRAIKEMKGLGRIRIEGHTDSDPIRKSGFKSNDELSLARASTVQTYLIRQGIDDSLLDVAGYGEKQPIAANTSPEGKARNRRVEIVLLGDQ
jgi:chemotaxis protein MotB